MELVLQVGSAFDEGSLAISRNVCGYYIVQPLFEGRNTLDFECTLKDLEELADKLAILILAAKKENI